MIYANREKEKFIHFIVMFLMIYLWANNWTTSDCMETTNFFSGDDTLNFPLHELHCMRKLNWKNFTTLLEAIKKTKSINPSIHHDFSPHAKTNFSQICTIYFLINPNDLEKRTRTRGKNENCIQLAAVVHLPRRNTGLKATRKSWTLLSRYSSGSGVGIGAVKIYITLNH